MNKAETHMLIFLVAAGGALGSVARYGIGDWVHHGVAGAFPFGTLIVNVAGSFLLGFLYGLAGGESPSERWRAFGGIGFCGGFTTFSTFSLDTVRMLERGEFGAAGLSTAANVSLSIVALFAGMSLAAALRR